MVYRGLYEYVIDAKNRLRIPSIWRSAFRAGVVLASWTPGYLTVWDPAAFVDACERQTARLNPNEALSQSRLLSVNSYDTQMDPSGRIRIPGYMLAHADLWKEVVFVGAGAHLELWSASRQWTLPVARTVDGDEADSSTVGAHELAGTQELALRVGAVRSDLVERIRARPELMHQLTPRQFEEFVAGLYSRQGFDVELTPETRDGGVDLYVVKHTAWGRLVTLVDCKKYRPDRSIGVDLVRHLLGTINLHDASAGVLATTSRFTDGAREIQAQYPARIGLQDYFGLQTMLSNSSLGSPQIVVPERGVFVPGSTAEFDLSDQNAAETGTRIDGLA